MSAPLTPEDVRWYTEYSTMIVTSNEECDRFGRVRNRIWELANAFPSLVAQSEDTAQRAAAAGMPVTGLEPRGCPIPGACSCPGEDTARLDWLERWLPVQPNIRNLTWDRSAKEFTLFQSTEDVQRLGMGRTVRESIDDARRKDAARPAPQPEGEG